MKSPGKTSLSLKIIIKPHDIILAHIFSVLHLNHFKRDEAWILQPVFGAGGDEGALACSDEEFVAVVCDESHSLDNDPVLTPVMVELEADAAARHDGYAFDLEGIPFLENSICTPGTVDGCVEFAAFISPFF